MHTVILLLESQLLRDALGLVLATAEIAVIDEAKILDGGESEGAKYLGTGSMITDAVNCNRRSEIIGAHRADGGKLVILATEAEFLGMNDEHLACSDGILTDDISVRDFIRCLHLIHSGERVVASNLMADLRARGPMPALPHFQAQPSDLRSPLTRREKDVLSHIVQGHSNKMIAWNLGMAEATVKVHIKSLLRKLDVENRTQAAIWALANEASLKKN